jgi:hypothetical protein
MQGQWFRTAPQARHQRCTVLELEHELRPHGGVKHQRLKALEAENAKRAGKAAAGCDH